MTDHSRDTNAANIFCKAGRKQNGLKPPLMATIALCVRQMLLSFYAAGLLSASQCASAGPTSTVPARILDSPTAVVAATPSTADGLNGYRTVTCLGRVAFADGKPAAHVLVMAQIQNRAVFTVQSSFSSSANESADNYARHLADEGNWARTDSEGRFVLPLSPNLPYNILYFDQSGLWVARAIEGIKGKPNTSQMVPTLVLTHGGIIQGRVLDKFHRPLSTAIIYCYDSERPLTTACCDVAYAANNGYYRLRVPQGHCLIYQARTGDGNASVDLRTREDEIVTVDLVSNISKDPPQPTMALSIR